MQTDSYAHFVRRKKKAGQDILDTLTPTKADAMHMAMGIVGEAGELLDAIKKHAVYNKPLDLDNIIEELGDMEFFMEGLRQIFNLTRAGIIAANVTKLEKRYGAHYTDAEAIARADKEK